MPTRHPRISRPLAILRWMVPALMLVLGSGYSLLEHLVIQGGSWSPSLLREVAFLGITGPSLAWLTLTWALRAAQSREQAEEKLARCNQQLARLNSVSLAVSRSLDLPEVLSEALRQVVGLLHADAGGIRILQGEGLTLQNYCGVSPAFAAQDEVVPVGECLCGLAVQHRRPYAANDLESAVHVTRGFCASEGLRAVLCAPLTSQTRVIGVVHVGRREPQPFSQEEEDFLGAIGAQIGMAIENARLYVQVKALNQELEARVQDRTAELECAQQEIAQKARQLQRLLTKTVQIQERERARIAHDMHNGVIQFLVGALYEVQAAKDACTVAPERAQERLRTALELMQQVEAEIRRTIYDLRPPILDAKGLAPALRQYVARYREMTGIPCTLHVSGTPRRLRSEAEVAIYRVVQEALHNVQAHAEATKAEVLVRFGARGLWLMIRDNGRGFNPEAVAREADRHLGLIGMRERIQEIGGQLDIETEPGHGTCIVIRTPAELFVMEDVS